MTKDEALKMVVEAKKRHGDGWWVCDEVIQACKEALDTEQVREDAVQPAQEPVAKEIMEFLPPKPQFTIEPHGNGYAIYFGRDMQHHGANLGHLTEITDSTKNTLEKFLNDGYTHPAPSWQGLSEDEIGDLFDAVIAMDNENNEFCAINFARAIEQALRNKNEGK